MKLLRNKDHVRLLDDALTAVAYPRSCPEFINEVLLRWADHMVTTLVCSYLHHCNSVEEFDEPRGIIQGGERPGLALVEQVSKELSVIVDNLEDESAKKYFALEQEIIRLVLSDLRQ